MGADHHRQRPRRAALGAELFGGAAEAVGDRRAQFGELKHRAAEGAARHDLLFGGDDAFQLKAGLAVQLAHRALEHHTEMLANRRRRRAAQIFDGGDAQCGQPGAEACPHSPHFADRRLGEQARTGD